MVPGSLAGSMGKSQKVQSGAATVAASRSFRNASSSGARLPLNRPSKGRRSDCSGWSDVK